MSVHYPSKNVYQSLNTLPNCNHHEADTRIILHALNSEDEIIVVANDTDVLILLVYAYALHRLSRQWKMKVDTNRYIEITTIGEYYGRDVCLVFAAYHGITGCDTTSFPYKVGKIKLFINMTKNMYYLLNHL